MKVTTAKQALEKLRATVKEFDDAVDMSGSYSVNDSWQIGATGAYSRVLDALDDLLDALGDEK